MDKDQNIYRVIFLPRSFELISSPDFFQKEILLIFIYLFLLFYLYLPPLLRTIVDCIFRLNSYSQFIPVCYRELSSSLLKQGLKYIKDLNFLRYYYSSILNQLISVKIFDNANFYITIKKINKTN